MEKPHSRLPLTPSPSPTQAGRGEKTLLFLAPLPEFGEGSGAGSEKCYP